MAQNSKRGWVIWGFSPETSAANANLRAKEQFTNKFNVNKVFLWTVNYILIFGIISSQSYQEITVYRTNQFICLNYEKKV